MTRPRLPESVSVRLTLWNVGVFALVLLALGAISHHVLRLYLVAAVDRQMAARSQGVIRRWERVRNPDPVVEPMRQPAGRGRDTASSTLGDGRHRSRAALAAVAWPEPAWAVEPAPPGHELVPRGQRPGGPEEASSPRLYRPKILTLARRDYFEGDAEDPWDERAFGRAAWGRAVRSTVTLGGDPVRVLSLPLYRDGRVAAVAQMARPIGEVTDALAASSRALLMLVPVALLLSGVVGVFLTSRALQPVRTLRRAAERVQAGSLSLRLPTPGGDEFSELAGTFNDMLDRLERAFRQQARFTADASHELRTPLTVLRGNLSLALSRPRTAEEYHETLERAHRATESMGRLVEDLLLLARADAAQLPFDAEPVSLHEVILAAVEAVPHREIGVAGVPPETPLRLRGNHALLVTLFTNLLSNADRHTPAEGTIAIRTSRAGHVVSVAVEDTGEGIAPEHLPHLSERFYRADPARSAASGGAGLGLAICRSIVEAHGGSLRVRSEVGKGTTVTVSLTLA